MVIPATTGQRAPRNECTRSQDQPKTIKYFIYCKKLNRFEYAAFHVIYSKLLLGCVDWTVMRPHLEICLVYCKNSLSLNRCIPIKIQFDVPCFTSVLKLLILTIPFSGKSLVLLFLVECPVKLVSLVYRYTLHSCI